MILPDFPPDRPLVCFSDLDGTLLDHDTYSFREAGAAVSRLVARGVPLIFCSSKTFAEQVYLQRQLKLNQPFIFENGSAVAIPKGYFQEVTDFPEPALPETAVERADYQFHVLARSGSEVTRKIIARFRHIRGFSGVTDAELSEATGLEGEALARARDRWFTETLLPPYDRQQLRRLGRRLASAGMELSRGGRFYTVQSVFAGKGKAVTWLSEVFRRFLGKTPLLAGIGDSPNDFSMLEAVDLPFLVQKPSGLWADVEIPGLVRVNGIGPAGFAAVADMLPGA